MIWRLERKDTLEGEERGRVCAERKRIESWNCERRKMVCI